MIMLRTDRGQTVVGADPYRVVCHPGYAGAILAWIAGPIFFSSYWVAIPSVKKIALQPTYKGNRR